MEIFDPFEQQLASLHNERFQPKQLIGTIAAVLNDAGAQTCGLGLSISGGDIDALVTCRDQTQRLLSDRFDKLILMARERLSNLRRYRDVALVSLGFDCLGRTVPTRWGLRPPRRLGAMSGPFDLAVHMPEVVENLILQGFQDYLDPKQLTYRPEYDFCTREGVSFNHETGPEYAENNFQLLREIYNRRIANFELALFDPRPLLLVAHSSSNMGIYAGQIEGMRRVVSHVAVHRSAPTRLIVIKTYEPGASPGCGEIDDAELTVHLLPLPWKGYSWYHPDAFLSDQGFAMERHMVQLLVNAVDRLRAQAGIAL